MPPPSLVMRGPERERPVRLISVLARLLAAGRPPMEPRRRSSRRVGQSPPDPRGMVSEWSSARELREPERMLLGSSREDIRFRKELRTHVGLIAKDSLGEGRPFDP